jgi:PAS domain S-box-containing protein
MKRFFRRLPLMAKLLIIAIVPLIFIAYLTIDLYEEKSGNMQQVNRYLIGIDQSLDLSRLASELQKERRHSFLFALTKKNQGQMVDQRRITDSIIRKLELVHDESLKDFTSYTFLGQLDSVRKLTDSNRYSANQIMHFYSSSIFRLNTMNKTPTLDKDYLKETYNDLTAQRLLSELLTYLSIINENVYNILFTRHYIVETLYGTYGTWDVYKTYKKEFALKAGSDTRRQFENLEEKGALNAVDSYLNLVFSTFKIDSSYTFQTWGGVADKSLNELHDLQEQLVRRVRADINSYYNRQLQAKNSTIIYLVLLTAFLMVLLAYILHVINSSLKELKLAALKLAAGETGIEVLQVSNDAIGSLATSIAKLDEKNKELAVAAQEIGKGNFKTPVSPRSENDLLGNAVVKMKDKLLTYTTDLQNAKDEFEKLADFMPQIIWVADGLGKITYYNKKWYEVAGKRDGGMEHAWTQILHPGDVGTTLSGWYRSLETGESFQAEFRFKDARVHEYRWYLGRAVPVLNADNRIVKWFGTATDIHDQKLQHEKLEDLVAERTLELNRSNEDLQQFAHVASHDLKEPLRKIRTFSDRLATECGHNITETGKVYISKLQTSSERMANMIDSILKYSVVNTTEPTREPIDLNVTIAEIINDLELLMVQKKAIVNFKNLPKIIGSPTLIYQLFYNLINNSLKFSKADTSARITVYAKELSSSELANLPDLKRQGIYHHLIVEDNGIGFNQEYADKMFNVFTRLNGRDNYEGTGLGLALCKKIVHRHNGLIYANSEEGRGSAFHVILPVMDSRI